MTESFRFRTRSGREILLVPATAIRPLDGGPNAWQQRALREDPRGASAMRRARDDAWSTSRDVVVVDLGLPASPGRALWGTGSEVVNWDDIPRLNPRPIGGATTKPVKPGVHDPRTLDPRTLDPRTLDPRTNDPRTNDPSAPDTWTSFVAFTVVDQHGKPLTGRARCSVDATVHARALDGTVIEYRPVPTLARIDLEIAELKSTAPATPETPETPA